MLKFPPLPISPTVFKDYKGGAAIQQGETFDPTPQNIEARVVRAKLPNGMKLVMFPKKTRGGTVVARINIHFGDEKSLFGKATAGRNSGRAPDARYQKQKSSTDSGSKPTS